MPNFREVMEVLLFSNQLSLIQLQYKLSGCNNQDIVVKGSDEIIKDLRGLEETTKEIARLHNEFYKTESEIKNRADTLEKEYTDPDKRFTIGKIHLIPKHVGKLQICHDSWFDQIKCCYAKSTTKIDPVELDKIGNNLLDILDDNKTKMGLFNRMYIFIVFCYCISQHLITKDFIF